MLLQEFQQTLQYHDNLNIKLFKNNKLKKQVIKQLIIIANLFRENCKVPHNVIKDIILTGGNAGYSYTSVSDVDVHIVIDFSKIENGDIDLVDYYKSKKELWSSEHNIVIYGYPVELYIQDSADDHPSGQAIYSILHDKWIVQPKQAPPDYDDPALINKVIKYIDKIDKCASIEEAKLLKDKLKSLRNSGLQYGGEFSLGNLAFKELRNLGYIQKFHNAYKSLLDRSLSL